MYGMRIALVGCLTLGIVSVAVARPDTKVDASKLVGTWTFVKTSSKDAPPPGVSMKVSFTKDGKINVATSFKDKNFKVDGTYSVKGDQLTTTLKSPSGKEKKETVTISELTDKKLVTVEKEGAKDVTTEFKK